MIESFEFILKFKLAFASFFHINLEAFIYKFQALM